ncbi:deoxynucleoside kinase [Candidatus Woesearchaeota archaeon]|nr:deoxynucleoside kinase [Candidatus Woesearchaeota archaeon]
MDAKTCLQEYLHQYPMIITIAGNIGLGKTTTAEALASDLEIAISRELDNNVLDQDLLWKFVQAPTEEKPYHCNVLQEDLCYRRLEARREQWLRGKTFIEDRAPEEDPIIFHQHFLNRGYLTPEQYGSLQQLWKAQGGKTPISEVMLMLHGSAALARSGIEQRGRPGELDAWQEQRDLVPLAELYRGFPTAVERYGLHRGVIVQVDRESIDPLQELHREALYTEILGSLRTRGRLCGKS